MIVLQSILATSALACTPSTLDEQPVELGRVRWGRDHAGAFARAVEAERPVLLLFQEIPG